MRGLWLSQEGITYSNMINPTYSRLISEKFIEILSDILPILECRVGGCPQKG